MGLNPDQEFRKMFNDRMNRLEDKMDTVDEKVSKVTEEMNTLKVKVAFFGSLAGSIATLIINKLLQ